jgi:hypothetical protein
MIDVGGRDAFARLIDMDAAYLRRVLSGQKRPSEKLFANFAAYEAGFDSFDHPQTT